MALRAILFVKAEGLSSVGPNCGLFWDYNLAGLLYLDIYRQNLCHPSGTEREFGLGLTSSAVQFCLLSSVGQKFWSVFSLILDSFTFQLYININITNISFLKFSAADIRICYRLSRPVIYQVLLEILRSQCPSHPHSRYSLSPV